MICDQLTSIRAGARGAIEILEGFRARSAGQVSVLGTDPAHGGEQCFIPLVLLPFGGLTAISGIFYPITHLPGWLQGIGQLFPMYWLGLGMRAALLPSHLAAVEIGGSWRLPYVFLALALWSVLGLATAPPVLRRMAQHESGAKVAARHERAMLRRA